MAVASVTMFSTGPPASKQTTSMPATASSRDTVAPPAPEPITATTLSSFQSNTAGMITPVHACCYLPFNQSISFRPRSM